MGMTKSEQARADHECSACDGSGHTPPCTDYDCIRLDHGDEGRHEYEACPTCEGFGRISDRMPAADSELDRQTVANFLHKHYPV